MGEIVSEIRNKLVGLQDLKYKEFHSKLIPSVKQDSIIGIKVPVLRKVAKVMLKEYEKDEIVAFMKDLPHKYYEENNLHGFLIEKIDDFDSCIYALEDFLPYVDNWATCDSIVPKCFKKDDHGQRERLLQCCLRWIKTGDVFTVRFGIEQLMRFYLDDLFSPDYLNIVASVKSQDYYVNMMRAWYFATALAKQYEATLPVFVGNHLDVWTHNKAIQKAIESKRLTDAQKGELKKYKIKRRI